MECFDALIAGAGPAGSLCALHLARAGLRVTIVERKRFPRRKVCGEYLSPGFCAELARLGLLEEIARKSLRIEGVTLNADGLEARFDFGSAALSLERSVLDETLLAAAVEAGAHLRTAHAHLGRRNGRASVIELRHSAGEVEQVSARYVVAADGLHSAIVRAAGVPSRRLRSRRFAIGGHYAQPLTESRVEMFVRDGSYFALNPLSGGRLNAMLVTDQGRIRSWDGQTDDGFYAETTRLSAGRRILQPGRRIGARASTGPLAYVPKARSAPGVLFAGDAAGAVDPFIGQGLLFAAQSAAAAAATVAAMLRDPDCEERLLGRYSARMGSALRGRRFLAAVVHGMLASRALRTRANARLRREPAAAASLLGAVAGMRPPLSALGAALRLLR